MAAVLLAGVCGCYSTRPANTARPPKHVPPAPAADASPKGGPFAPRKASANGPREVKVPAAAAVAPVTSVLQQVAYSVPPGPPPGAAIVQTVFHPAEPRVGLEACPDAGATGALYGAPGLSAAAVPPIPGAVVAAGGAAPAGVVLVQPPPSPIAFPDEYLCDGGDRAAPVHYDQYHRHGLDSSDAVAEYTDHTGQFHVTPTNTVCVYAPRFAAMRTISSPAVDNGVGQAAGAEQLAGGVGLRARTATSLNLHNERLGGVNVRSRPSGLVKETMLVGVRNRLVIATSRELTGTWQDLSFFRTGQLVRTEEARLKYGLQAANIWTRKQNPIIQATTLGGQQVEVEFTPQEIIGVEDRRTTGVLRIVKTADKVEAQPGETIIFTLRYDNMGDLPLNTIRIVDNLTPRLEYIDASVISDRAGDVVVEPNGEGSSVLTFVMDEPLPGHTGGVVTFKTRVK